MEPTHPPTHPYIHSTQGHLKEVVIVHVHLDLLLLGFEQIPEAPLIRLVYVCMYIHIAS
jgi:hypothetical protein